ncbi:hypothetical protein [Rummeliibacillus pycnus]|uniref:hypothetical protein n=1 Tax=Rummeliibacillus pycnus TaxID=101070 RepID=UPI003D2C540A
MSNENFSLSVRFNENEDKSLIEFLATLPKKYKSQIVRNMLKFSQQHMSMEELFHLQNTNNREETTAICNELKAMQKLQLEQFDVIMDTLNKLQTIGVHSVASTDESMGNIEKIDVEEVDEALVDSAEAFLMGFNS